MSVISIHAFQVLADYLASAIPELAGHICPFPAEPGHLLGSESLGIEPISFKYFPNQAQEMAEVSFDTSIERVGHHEVDCLLRLNAPTARRRAILASKITEVFLSQDLSPGVLTLPIPQVYDVRVAWEFTREEWESERVFDKKWYSTLTILAQIPALVTRGGIFTIDQLQLAIYEDPSADLDTTITPETFSSDLDVVDISETGVLSPVD
jgi:hypothetical protein